MERVWETLNFGLQGWGGAIASGIFTTILLALCTLPIGLLLGLLVALAKQSEDASLRLAGNIYTTIFRGVPELLTLFMIYFGVQIGAQKIINLVDPTAKIEINNFIAGLVGLCLVFSSYTSEVFLSALRAIPRGQYEGGTSLSLSKTQTMRLIVLPQLIRIALPGLTNLWLILVKDTSLVSVIGVSDIMRQSGIAARVTRDPFLFFSLACLIYLVLAMFSSLASGALERSFKKGDQ